MVREERYLVLKWEDIEKYVDSYEQGWLSNIQSAIYMGRKSDGKNPYPKFVCVKDTYPEYEYVWEQIEKRVDASK